MFSQKVEKNEAMFLNHEEKIRGDRQSGFRNFWNKGNPNTYSLSSINYVGIPSRKWALSVTDVLH